MGFEALLGAGSSLSDDLRGRDVLEMRSACWACEGWERMEILWPCDDEARGIKLEPKIV